ncbi:MAG: EscJ/YscJ/HrcJ family type III secretion inner membrane ring protein [Chlamydiales bacterium]
MRFRLQTLFFALILLVACETNMVIVNDVEEREANEIVVFLASKKINADKIPSPSAGPAAGGAAASLWSIAVPPAQSTEAMAQLNQNGLPRRKGVNLLDLFAKAGLMSSEKEETIRYQAGLAEQIANTIRKIDGVIDADVQLSFPPAETTSFVAPGTAAAPAKKVTASVYVKHQGILDDPNSHLVTKIKRLVAGSVSGLDVNDVTIISDRSRFADITLMPQPESLAPKPKEYVSIWSIVMSKTSASRFRTLFFILTLIAVVLAAGLGWLIWKFYPVLKRGRGLRELFNPIPVDTQSKRAEQEKKSPEERR